MFKLEKLTILSQLFSSITLVDRHGHHHDVIKFVDYPERVVNEVSLKSRQDHILDWVYEPPPA